VFESKSKPNPSIISVQPRYGPSGGSDAIGWFSWQNWHILDCWNDLEPKKHGNWYESWIQHIWHNADTGVSLISYKMQMMHLCSDGKIYLVIHVFIVLYIISRKEGCVLDGDRLQTAECVHCTLHMSITKHNFFSHLCIWYVFDSIGECPECIQRVLVSTCLGHRYVQGWSRGVGVHMYGECFAILSLAAGSHPTLASQFWLQSELVLLFRDFLATLMQYLIMTHTQNVLTSLSCDPNWADLSWINLNDPLARSNYEPFDY